MLPTRDEIKKFVIETLCEFAEDPVSAATIDESTNPMRIFHLESQDGIEVACVLSQRLGFEIPPEINPLVDDAQHRSRRIHEIIDLLHNLTTSIGETCHA